MVRRRGIGGHVIRVELRIRWVSLRVGIVGNVLFIEVPVIVISWMVYVLY